MRRLASTILALGVLAGATPAGRAGDTDAAAIENLVKQFPADKAFRGTVLGLELRLERRDADAQELGRRLLARAGDLAGDAKVAALLDGIARDENPAVAADLLLRIAQARRAVKDFHKGHVIVGRLAVADGKLSPELVLAQMPILPEGYFAGEVGDLERPVGFRAHSYANLDLALAGKQGEVIDVGRLTLKPLPPGDAATLTGRVVLDGAKRARGVRVTLAPVVGPINTPHNGYSPRRRWPADVPVEVARTGAFEARGLSPCRYRVEISADKYVSQSRIVTLRPGETTDLGRARLRWEDLGTYLGKPAPKTEALAWEKDYATALQRAREARKPLLVMMTSTTCVPCRKLERQTLADPWVRYFLADFVLVKAYEDPKVEAKYGCNGYPTLVFTDPDGKAAYKAVGYKPSLRFTADCVRAFRKLDLRLPAEMQTLLDKKVLGE